MTRDSFNRRAAFSSPDGPYVKGGSLPRLGYFDRLRREEAKLGSAALLAAYRRYFASRATGLAIARHEADKRGRGR